MQRYFIPKDNWGNNTITITEDDAHHITRVMRNNVNDEIICVSPEGQAAKCRIVHLAKNEVKVDLIEWLDDQAEMPVQTTIVQGLPRSNKLELILQKGTELGATCFSLFEADRSVAKWNNKRAEQRLARYRKIVKEASEQSHRNHIPTVHAPVSLEEIAKEGQHYDIRLFAYEEEARTKHFTSFSTSLSEMNPNGRIMICIGPEGGISPEEATLLKRYNFTAVRLGPRILRTETASMYALASISYHFEELGWQS